jgi:hypothetical protein
MQPKKYQKTIQLLNDCAAACNYCSSACLDELDVKLNRCIKIDIDCAQLCTLLASFAARNSEHTMHLTKECAEICNICAEECEKHAHMEHCKNCAEICRACADECNSLEE